MTINPGGWGVQGALEEQVLGAQFNPSVTTWKAGSWAAVSRYPIRGRLAGKGECFDRNRFSSCGVPKQIQNSVLLPSPECKLMQNRALENVLLTNTYHGSTMMFSCWRKPICGFCNQVHWTKWLSTFCGTWWSKGNLVWFVQAGWKGGSQSGHEKCLLPLQRASAGQCLQSATPMEKQEITLKGREGTEFVAFSSLSLDCRLPTGRNGDY